MGKSVRVVAAILLILLLAAGISRAEVFKVAMPSTTQAVLAFTIARDKGYYRAEGLWMSSSFS